MACRGRELARRLDELLDHFALRDRAERADRATVRRLAAARRAGQGNDPSAAVAAARRAEHGARSGGPQRPVAISAATGSEQGTTIVLTTHLPRRSRRRRPDCDSERRPAGGAGRAGRAAVAKSAAIRSRLKRLRRTNWLPAIREPLRLGRHASSKTPCGWKCRMVTLGFRRIVEAFPGQVNGDSPRQADAGRRVHRPHGPSVLASSRR